MAGYCEILKIPYYLCLIQDKKEEETLLCFKFQNKCPGTLFYSKF